MTGEDWSREEAEATVADYLAMLALELSGSPYSKASHRRALKPKLNGRSEGAIEFKHANISAALIQSGLPFISGYKPRPNFQGLLTDVLLAQVSANETLLSIIAADVDRPMPVPEVDDILSILRDRPTGLQLPPAASDPGNAIARLPTDYLKREAINQALGNSGERFVLNYERARLLHAGCDKLAGRIEHTAKTRGDSAGYDILSYDPDGSERLIEVKTTKYGRDTPFFATANEVAVSEANSSHYFVYRLYQFRDSPSLYTVPGAISTSCSLAPVSFKAVPR